MMEPSKVVRMGYVIQEYLRDQKLEEAKPKDLMQILVAKGYFKKDHRDGLPLRNLLRKLDDNKQLYLLPQVRIEHKDKNRFWYFNVLRL